MIAFENAAYSYSGEDLLSDVSLQLAPGSFHFLTGPSGSGKSTFLKLAYAELRPTGGRVTLFERDVTSLSRDDVARTRRRIGIVHQDCKFLDHLTLAANMALPFTVSDRESDPRDLDELLAWVGLRHLAKLVAKAGAGDVVALAHHASPGRQHTIRMEWRAHDPRDPATSRLGKL